MLEYKIFINSKKGEKYNTSMHFRNALNAAIYAVSRAFFPQFLAKFRVLVHLDYHKSVRLSTVLLYWPDALQLSARHRVNSNSTIPKI